MAGEPTEDLKAFERRLREIIDNLTPIALRWRIVLAVISICTAVGSWHWLRDAKTYEVPLLNSFCQHPFFAISVIILVGLLFMGVHKKVVIHSIIAERCRTVLSDYNMSCDDSGKLILKPRPAN